MRIDIQTAIEIGRRVNDVALELVNGEIGAAPAKEARVCRVLGWMGPELWEVITPWVIHPGEDPPFDRERWIGRTMIRWGDLRCS
jgi:hypothetical protein